MTPNKQRVLIASLIVLGILVAGFFGWRSFRAFKEFRGHSPNSFPPPAADAQEAETDVELIREWMTIGYLSHTYRLPRNLLYEALNIPPRGNEKKSLEELNQEYFPDQPGFVLETVKATIQSYLYLPTKIPNSNP